MKKLFLLGACLLALSMNPVMSYAGNPKVVVVRVQDNGGNIRLSISRADGKSEFAWFRGGASEKGMTDAGAEYQKLIAKLYEEGYALKSTFSSGASEFTTLVFVKGE